MGMTAPRLDEQRYRFLTEQLSDMVSCHAPDGAYLYASSACRELLGYEPWELEGSDAYAYFHPEDVEVVSASHLTVLAGQPFTVTYRIRRKDGEYVWVETVNRPILDESSGEIREILCSTRRVTDRDAVLRAAGEARLGGLKRIRRALSEDILRAVYQPIFHLPTGDVIAYEALARFDDDRPRPPNVWFEEAAALGLSIPLELAALRAAFAQADDLPAPLSVNVSPALIVSRQLHRLLQREARQGVIVEVTEHAAVCDYTTFNAAVDELRSEGARLAIDDVGAGFASLRHILQVRPDFIKLDTSLTRGIAEDEARQVLARALLSFAADTATPVIAEGVESEDELQALVALGAEHAQGYHLGRPGPASRAARAGEAWKRLEGAAVPALW
jgi:PAS domain S-box-containing protein